MTFRITAAFTARTSAFVLGVVLTTSPISAQDGATIEAGDELRAAGDLVGAAMIYEVVTAREPANAVAWNRLGTTFLGLGRFEEALAAHVEATLDPATVAEAAFGSAAACSRLGRVSDGITWLQKAQAQGHPAIASARTSADFEALRGDPRFAQMLPAMVPADRIFVEGARVLYTLDGEAAGDQFGWVARVVGDLDGDGVLDFASTSPTHGSVAQAAGRVYVYSGKSGKLLFAIDGEDAGGQLGNSVAPAGDVNGDGTPDVFAGAPGGGGNGSRAGTAIVASGKDGSVLLELSAGEAGDAFGMKVCGLGDLDGDGHADLFAGASGARSGQGRGYAYSGKSGELLWTVDGEGPGDGFGISADATRDGTHPILAVGASTAKDPETGNRVGRVYVYRVSAEGAEPLFTIDPDATASNLGQYFVAIAGDVDADGVPDVYASDWGNAAKGPSTGRCYVHSGATGERILTLTGPRAGEGFGTSPSTAGDVNGDGHADFIVGAWQAASGAPSGGACYLHSGRDGALLHTWTNRQPGDTFGFDAVGMGDVDGDGAVDFLLTSAWSPVRGPRTGRTFVIAGPKLN